jgi:hypothetical protein
LKPRRIDEDAVQNKIANCNRFNYRHNPEKQQFLMRRLAKEMTAMLLKPNSGELFKESHFLDLRTLTITLH